MRDYSEILKNTVNYIKSLPVKSLGRGTVVSLYVKSPNLFYNTKRVYLRINNDPVNNITETINNSTKFNLSDLYLEVKVAKDYHFIDESTPFNSPYFVITLMIEDDGNWTKAPVVTGSISPDPLDSNGITPIRK